jgi:hypothetical protein
MENYKFSVPIRINYIIDESTLSIDCLDDLSDIEDKYSIDLDFILDEYDYKVEMEEEAMEDEDYYGIEEDEIFANVITENWNRIVKKLNKICKLDELEDSDVELFFNITKENFKKHIKNNNDFNIKSISLIDFNKIKSEFYINVECENKLNKEEIESLKNWIETQTSENWGEDFSKIDLSEKFDNEDVYIYLIPWATNKDVKYVK